ncbi:UDP-N-acetylmuramate dehydrogenase [Geobacter sp. SVR]|uniref:UDP-N-acetylmuramate dehydrogenase n=1 Tax=Geobacter sp. SVR TaxID=2495594 RepID=UPI00143F041D|nr:UDP-N-acetylmuramate dehydrogenase [Geobacter sp. SVR]BCS52032.1 UDP-N-acetylenolpyruvoylglucosamine reductase [Geobacter sp. SVR]GCF87154.1 UDP-N-acetylenolpyruvoylglucosamine reductase [Geobacter sp. SVR]
MELLRNHSLRPYNTLNVDATARYFARIRHVDQIGQALAAAPEAERILVLGGGSNVVFRSDFSGLVLKNEIRGIRIVRSDDAHVWIESRGGEEWQDLVDFSLEHDLGGLENLTRIPGSVGAAPVQNIGAYGVEIKDLLESVEAVDIRSGQVRTFSNSECRFGYRDSIFKHELKGLFFVTGIVIRLARQPEYHIEYGDIRKKLEEYGDQPLSPRLLERAISEIRAVKLPDPRELGNCGSFFKNCIVTPDDFERLRTSYPALPFFREHTGQIKIPSAWLIEQCGWKGWRSGDAAVYPQHALILVNYGAADGEQIYDLSERIIASVRDTFGLVLEREAQII